jgi:hypothetical protein
MRLMETKIAHERFHFRGRYFVKPNITNGERCVTHPHTPFTSFPREVKQAKLSSPNTGFKLNRSASAATLHKNGHEVLDPIPKQLINIF